MKLTFLPLILFVSISSTVQSYPHFLDNYEMCLKHFLTDMLVEGGIKKTPQECVNSKEAVLTIINEVYQNSRESLLISFQDEQHVECLMSKLRERKFLEASILISLTSELNKRKELMDYLERSLSISFLQCAEPENLIKEIFTDLSEKLKIDDKTLFCIEKTIHVGNPNNDYDEINHMNEEFDTTMQPDISNLMENLPTMEASYDIRLNSASFNNCNTTLNTFNRKMFKFQYTSLTSEENQCVSENISNDVECVIDFYQFVYQKNKKSETESDIEVERKSFKNFLVKLILYVARCGNFLQF
jgi:hypothetical protein